MAFSNQDNPKLKKCGCGGAFIASRGCGVLVCDNCDEHFGLARCYCGWSASGGNGHAELLELGETIDEEW